MTRLTLKSSCLLALSLLLAAGCKDDAVDDSDPGVTDDSGDSGDSGGECLCGEGDGCEFCPMVGACLDPPAPIGPRPSPVPTAT